MANEKLTSARSRATALSAPTERPHVYLDEVRLHLLEVDGHAGLDEALGQPAGVRRGRRQPLDVVVERVEAAAATIPAWRIAPPKRCLRRRAFAIRSREPATSAPERVAEPLGEAQLTVSNSRPYSAERSRSDRRR